MFWQKATNWQKTNKSNIFCERLLTTGETMKLNESVLVFLKKDYVHGFFKDYDGRRVQVQIGKQVNWHPVNRVFINTYGYVRPVKGKLSKHKGGIKKLAAYDSRKIQENELLIQDMHELGFNINTCKLLALDDFIATRKSCTNTLGSWIEAGGQAGNVFVPNPNPNVVQAVIKNGAYGFEGTLYDFLQKCKNMRQVVDVAYLDFCGFFKTNKDSLELLFSRGILNKTRSLVHVTFCKREGNGVVENVHNFIDALSRKYKYGRCLRIHMSHSQTMWKGAFVIGGKAILPKKKG
jgi:hypothetical protein